MKKLHILFVLGSTLCVFNSSIIFGGFGRGFAAGAGTFLGASIIGNAIAQSNQPRVVYVGQPQQPIYANDRILEQRAAAREAQEQMRLAHIEQENLSKALALKEEKLRLRKRELALQEANLQHALNTKNN